MQTERRNIDTSHHKYTITVNKNFKYNSLKRPYTSYKPIRNGSICLSRNMNRTLKLNSKILASKTPLKTTIFNSTVIENNKRSLNYITSKLSYAAYNRYDQTAYYVHRKSNSMFSKRKSDSRYYKTYNVNNLPNQTPNMLRPYISSERAMHDKCEPSLLLNGNSIFSHRKSNLH